MPRIIFLSGLGLALVGLALSITEWALSFQPGPTRANTLRLRPGMTLDQVEALVGKLPFGERDRLQEMFLQHDRKQALWDQILAHAPGEDGTAVLCFDGDGRLRWGEWSPGERPSERPGVLSRLRAWLGL